MTGSELASVYGQLRVAGGRLEPRELEALRELDGLLAAAEHVLKGTPVGAGAHSTICGMILNAYASGLAADRQTWREHVEADHAALRRVWNLALDWRDNEYHPALTDAAHDVIEAITGEDPST